MYPLDDLGMHHIFTPVSIGSISSVFSRFKQALETFELPILEEKGYQYHLSPPGFVV